VPRNINPAVLAAIATGNIRMGILVSIATLSGTVYAWTGYGPVVYAGNTYSGLGALTNISAISESSSVTSQGVTLTLNGVDPTNISEALTDIPQGGDVYILFVVLDASNNVVGVPIISFAGQTDGIVIKEAPDGTSAIALDVENRLTQLQRDRTYRWTQAQQAELFPGDTGFLYTADLQDYVALWGNTIS
jgi:hypothetical protein